MHCAALEVSVTDSHVYPSNTMMELLLTPWEARFLHSHHRTPSFVRRHHFNPLRRDHRPFKPYRAAELGHHHHSIRSPQLENMFSVHSLMKSLPGSRVLRLQQPSDAQVNGLCSQNVETDIQDGIIVTRVRLPRNTKAEDVTLDLDEFSRVLTIRVRNWEQKLTLDTSLDLELLKASFDESKNELSLRTFPSDNSNVEQDSRMHDVPADIGYISEEEHPPSECSPEPPRETPSPCISIEDVGPEEEIDRISISSTEAD